MMKKTIILMMALCLSAVTFAQQKIAHINAQEVLEAMPEFKAASDSMKATKAILDKDLAELEADIKKLYEEYQREGQTWSAAKVQIREQDLQRKQEQYQALQKAAQNELIELNNKLMLPLEDKIMDAIDAVAKENGYAYVVDAAMMIYAQGEDLGPKVRAHLGVPDGDGR